MNVFCKVVSLLSLMSAGTVLSTGTAEAASVYLGLSNGEFGTVETTTGQFTSISRTPVFFDIAVDRSIGFGVTGRRQLLTLDPTSGSTSVVGSTRAFINGLAFDGSGNLFGSGGRGFYSINQDTGAATLLTNINGFSSSGDIAFDGSRFFLTGAGGDRLFSVNPDGTGASLIGRIGFARVYGLTFQDNTLFGLTDRGTILDIDPTTGVGTQIGATVVSGSIYGTAPVNTSNDEPESMPEPSTVMGVLLAAGAVGYRRKYRKTHPA